MALKLIFKQMCHDNVCLQYHVVISLYSICSSSSSVGFIGQFNSKHYIQTQTQIRKCTGQKAGGTPLGAFIPPAWWAMYIFYIVLILNISLWVMIGFRGLCSWFFHPFSLLLLLGVVGFFIHLQYGSFIFVCTIVHHRKCRRLLASPVVSNNRQVVTGAHCFLLVKIDVWLC